MKKLKLYLSFIRIRFNCSIQYRGAAISGIITQFAWGFMQILLYKAFYEVNPERFPMGMSQLASYFWLQQAFMNLFMTWFLDNDILDTITSGTIAYELCRPINLYNMWYVKSFSSRITKTFLRCIPIIIISLLLPEPYGLVLPNNIIMWIEFIISIILGFLVVISFSMLIYIITFFTLSPIGVRVVALSAMEFLSGGIIPLPFLPRSIRQVVELLPFACMQNMPFRIFNGDISGINALNGILLQIFWLVVLINLGKALTKKAIESAVVQGG